MCGGFFQFFIAFHLPGRVPGLLFVASFTAPTCTILVRRPPFRWPYTIWFVPPTTPRKPPDHVAGRSLLATVRSPLYEDVLPFPVARRFSFPVMCSLTKPLQFLGMSPCLPVCFAIPFFLPSYQALTLRGRKTSTAVGIAKPNGCLDWPSVTLTTPSFSYCSTISFFPPDHCLSLLFLVPSLYGSTP